MEDREKHAHEYRPIFESNRLFTMEYTLEERLDIGRRICNGVIIRYQAAEEYRISNQTAR